jgi:membrane-associated phospholipid phosphatase
MTVRPRALWHWPGWRQLGFFALLGLVVGLWFELIYGGADYLTSLHTYRVRVHLDLELHTPFWPQAVLGYSSIYLLLWSAPLILRTRQELRALAVTLMAVILVAGVFFLVVPGELAFPPLPADMGIWTGMVLIAKKVALTNNLVPSLHVAMSVVCITLYARQARPVGRVLLWLWAVVIGLSTLLLHQHYLIDVLTGFALALAGVRLVYDRLVPAGA